MNLLFLHNCLTPFVKLDLQLLSRRFVVREFCVRVNHWKALTVLRFISWADVVVCWFASWHSVLPAVAAALLSKPLVLIAGGYDTANLPDIQYGNQRGGIKRVVSRSLLRHASLVVVNSHYAAREVRTAISGVDRPIAVVHHGVPDHFGNDTNNKIPNRVITVGNINRSNLLRKGIQRVCEASRLVPTAEFVVAGRFADTAIDHLRSISGSNVRFTGYLSDSELLTLYRSASVYVQPSLHEAFGMSVAESMLAGCIPVVSDRGALPEVVGNCGVVLRSCEPASVAAGVIQGLRGTETDRSQVRSRIVSRFPMDKRERELANAIISCRLQ